MTPPYFTLLTAVLLVFSAPCLAQTVVTTSSTPTERHVMGIGDRVLYDSADPAYATRTYTANPQAGATLNLTIEGVTQVWSLTIIMGSTVHFAYFGTKGDTTFPISLDPGTYDVALYQSGFAEGALIYKNIQVQGVTFDTLRVSDAVNTYTAEIRDEMGNHITSSMWRGTVFFHQPSSSWHLTISDGGGDNHTLRHDDVPPEYGFDIEMMSHPNLTKRYRVGFRKRIFAEDEAVSNDPKDYRRYAYTLPIDDPAEPDIILVQAMGGPGHASWLPTNSFALRPPYQVETYLQRQPDVSFPYFALSDFGGPPYRFASFEQPMVLLS